METNKEDLKIERQKYQMHKEGYANIVSAIKDASTIKIEVPPVTVNVPDVILMDLKDTNKILNALVEKMNEPVCLTLKLK